MFRFSRPRTPNRIYLDNAAATKLSPAVLRAMQPWLSGGHGNPSAIHSEGLEAREAIDEARRTIARLLHVRPEGIVFTGNGTESNNLAIFGIVRALVESGKNFAELEIISTRIEHPSVIEVLKHLEEQGVTVNYCPVDEFGVVDIVTLEGLLSIKTALVTFAYANSEVGTIQPVRKISRMVAAHNKKQGTATKIHLDAAQAPLWLSCELDRLGVDLMTLDAGKCHGPKGVGVLAFRHGVQLKGVLLGGGQEFNLRAGTENVAGIVGAAKALELAQTSFKERVETVAALRDIFIQNLLRLEGILLNGHQSNRLANNINISIPGVDTEYATVWLDRKGVACSTKSACSGASGGGSTVVRELTQDESLASSTMRFSLGNDTRQSDTVKAVEELKGFLQKTALSK